MNMKKLLVVFLLGAGGMMAGHSMAKEGIDAVELMRQVEQEASAKDEMVRLAMTLVDANGKTSKRSAVYLQKQRSPGSSQDMKLIRFDSPPELSGSGVLTLENEQRADDQWLYLPAYHTSRKVPPSSRSDRYMGTDFFYEDVSADKIAHYDYSAIGREEIDGRAHVIVEQIPQTEQLQQESAYGKKVQWVDPERLLVSRIDYYDKNGKLMKRYQASGAAQIAGRWRWREASMTDLRINHKTRIKYTDRVIDDGLEDRLFTVRNLERGR